MKIELLAPAKNKQCAISAINYGADAIYIGADNFGARQKATNNYLLAHSVITII